MSSIQHPHFRFAYDDAGDGQPILFIHGYPLNRKMWQPQLAEFYTLSHRVIVPDLRGHGDSSPTEGEYSMDLLAEDCAYLLDQLGIKQPIAICGLSMGGYIAFAFLRKFPQKVKALILTATRAAPDSPEAKEKRIQAVQQVQTSGLQPIIESMLPRLISEHTQHTNSSLIAELQNIMEATSIPAVVGDLKGMMSRPDSRPLLADIKIPALIIHGKDDALIPLQEAEEMHNAIHGSRFVIIENAAHLPNLEAPSQFNSHLRSFLESLP